MNPQLSPRSLAKRRIGTNCPERPLKPPPFEGGSGETAPFSWNITGITRDLNGWKISRQRCRRGGLAFTTRIEDGAGADIFLSCGALHYLEQDLATCLRRLQPLPPRVLVNRIPLYEGETFFTIQSSLGSVVPYRIQNRQELVDSMIELDYQLVDCWSEKREVVIPFHPQRSVDEFYGFYFASSKVASKDRNRDAVVTAHEVCARIAPLWMAEKPAQEAHETELSIH